MLQSIKNRWQIAKCLTEVMTKDFTKDDKGSLDALNQHGVALGVLVVTLVFLFTLVYEFTQDVPEGSWVDNVTQVLIESVTYFAGKIKFVVMAIVFVIIMGYLYMVRRSN